MGELQAYQHLHDRGAKRRERERKNFETYLKKMTENFPNLVKEIDIPVQKVKRISNKMNPKRNTLRPINIKMPKVKHKERILKAAREKQLVASNSAPTRLLADFSEVTLQARRDWQEIFKVVGSKD